MTLTVSLDERWPGRRNRFGRPHGVPRQHVNRYGRPKPAMSMPEAVGLALSYTHDRWLNPNRARRLVNAYECKFCGSWHVGTPRRPQPVLRIELGDRAYWNLMAVAS